MSRAPQHAAPSSLFTGQSNAKWDARTDTELDDEASNCSNSCQCQGCDASLPAPVLLATVQATAALAVDGTNVYWLSILGNPGYQIVECAIGGCGGAPTVLANGFMSFADTLVVGNGDVIWGEVGNDTLDECSVAGCNDQPTQLTHALPAQLATDGQSVYWLTNTGSSSSGNALMTCAIGGCGEAPTQLWSEPSADFGQEIAVDDTYVYWLTYSGELLECGKAGCNGQPTTLASGLQNPSLLVVDGKNAYWISSTASTAQILMCPRTGCGDGPTPLVSQLNPVYALATDGQNAYWAEEIGEDSCTSADPCAFRIARCSVSGCSDAPATLAVSTASLILQIALDDRNVYWLAEGRDNVEGQIWMLAK